MRTLPIVITNCWTFSQIFGFFDMKIQWRDPTGGSSFLRIGLSDLKRRREIFNVPAAIGRGVAKPTTTKVQWGVMTLVCTDTGWIRVEK